MKILLVEDDRRLAELTKDYLQENGFSVHIEGRGNLALSHFHSLQPDLVILDLALPGMDGLTICRELRREFSGPILMLTAKDTSLDEVVGLEAGADDYLYKPADPMVLLARIRALLRRKEDQSSELLEDIRLGELYINFKSREVLMSGKETQVTSLEFEILRVLAGNAGKIVDRDQLHREARGVSYDGLDRTVDVRISRLRKKLGDIHEPPKRIKTIWGKGYLLVPDAW